VNLNRQNLNERIKTVKYEAVIFDLDGVILSTDDFHYKAWKKMADREGIYFDRTINERLRGVSRMESLAIILERAQKKYTEAEKVEMATFKNNFYRESLNALTPADIFPGVPEFLKFLKDRGIKIAIGSSSKNAKFILKQIGMGNTFDAVSDGTNITNSKPDPEVFLMAAEMVAVAPERCLVIEDAEAGIDAAKAGGMDALGIGFVSGYSKNDYSFADIQSIGRSIFG
jgi:beta-phosphoglucomutase